MNFAKKKDPACQKYKLDSKALNSLKHFILFYLSFFL